MVTITRNGYQYLLSSFSQVSYKIVHKRKRAQPIGRRNLKSMLKMALGSKFKHLKTSLADYVVSAEVMGIHDVTSWLERHDLTEQSFGEGFANLINTVIDAHRSFRGGFCVPCDRNQYARNAAMIDEDEVVAPALVPDQASCAAVSDRNVRRAVTVF